MFRLPEITYPLSIDTVGKMLAMGHEMSVHCHTHGCGHDGRVNLTMLANRFGVDHPCLAADLAPHFHCGRCRAAGRPAKNISFIHHPLTLDHSAWPREREEWRQTTIRARAG